MSLFGGDASDLLLLAEDAARILGRSRVEPVHLLLAFARRRPVSDLLVGGGVTARSVHAAVVGGEGLGDELVLGRLPRSPSAEQVLHRAVAIAAERGERRPAAEHVLLALGDNDHVHAILRDLGTDDLQSLVNEHHPPRGPALSDEQVRVDLVAPRWRRTHDRCVRRYRRLSGSARAHGARSGQRRRPHRGWSIVRSTRFTC